MAPIRTWKTTRRIGNSAEDQGTVLRTVLETEHERSDTPFFLEQGYKGNNNFLCS